MQQIPTRERLLTESMRLFGEQGYQDTTVAQIEAAAGLAPGSGALYNHFKSKEELLQAGIDRQLDRRSAMRDIRSLFAGLGDLRSELIMMGRYMLAVLDDETQLLRIASRAPAAVTDRLNSAYAALFDGLYFELADWVRGWVPKIADTVANTIGALGVNALLGRRVTNTFLHPSTIEISDETYIAEWATTLIQRIEGLSDHS